ncbi:MAG: hypothetical protein AAF490_20330 [Chloroflexota bacterium]
MRFFERLGVFPFLILGIALFLLGLFTLNSIINNWWPFDVARIDLVRGVSTGQIEAATLLDAARADILLAFLGTILITMTGLALPLAYVLNKRFSYVLTQETAGSPQFLVTLRQAMGVGIWVSFSVWLQMNRALNLAIAMLVGIVLLLFELLLQIRSRASEAS